MSKTVIQDPDDLHALVERAATHELTRRELVTLASAIGAGAIATSQLSSLRVALGISSPRKANSAQKDSPGQTGSLATGAAGGPGTLVVIWLSGGNDSLNTVVPVLDPTYHSLRPTIKLTPTEVLALGGSSAVGLHPSLANLHKRYIAGRVALVQGIGYTNNDMSHFESAAYWEHGYGAPGSAIAQGVDGWLGRWANTQAPNPFRQVTFRNDDLSMSGSNLQPIRLNPWASNITGGNQSDSVERLALKALTELAGPTGLGPLANAVGAQTSGAISVGSNVAPLYAGLPNGSSIERQLMFAARLINANIGVRVINGSYGSFDTHSEQAIRGSASPYGAHGRLLSTIDSALESLFVSLTPEKRATTTVLLYSEFGRRPQENGSFGTDHGSAGLAMLIGDNVTGGLFGDAPSLTKLDSDGNLIPTSDFRSLYATVISQYLGGDASAVIGSSVEPLALVQSDGAGSSSTVPGSTVPASTVPVSTLPGSSEPPSSEPASSTPATTTPATTGVTSSTTSTSTTTSSIPTSTPTTTPANFAPPQVATPMPGAVPLTEEVRVPPALPVPPPPQDQTAVIAIAPSTAPASSTQPSSTQPSSAPAASAPPSSPPPPTELGAPSPTVAATEDPVIPTTQPPPVAPAPPAKRQSRPKRAPIAKRARRTPSARKRTSSKKK